MADYISREAVIKMINESNAWHPECAHVLGPLRREIMNHQPADVRPVVLCRDCKHRPYSTEPGETSGFAVEVHDRPGNVCPCYNDDDGYYSWVPPDDFYCANGERRGADMRPEPPEGRPAP